MWSKNTSLTLWVRVARICEWDLMRILSALAAADDTFRTTPMQ